MITNERLATIAGKLISYLSERLKNENGNGDELYSILSNRIGMTDNEIDQLSGNFDSDREEFDDDITTRYYVCALGYDSNHCCTDYERDFGDFDTIEEAHDCYSKIVESAENNPNSLFSSHQRKVAYWKIQLEECEEYGEEINCIDVLAEADIEIEEE